MESIQIYPNLIHSGDQIVIKGNSFIQNTDFIKIYNGEGKLLKSTRFQKNGEFDVFSTAPYRTGNVLCSDK